MNDQTRTSKLDPRTNRAERRPGAEDGSTSPGVDETERDVVTSGIAQTSEVADRDAQRHAEGQGDGTPQPR